MNFPQSECKYLTLPKSAEYLGISEYRLRLAVEKGEIFSKRSSNAVRARYLFKIEWLDTFQKYMAKPTLTQKIMVWVRKQF
jgi:hypothetical protein